MAFGFQSSSYIPDFRNLSPNELDGFIAQYLQPNETFHSLASSALDTLCRYLQYEMRPNVRRIVKSGSMGKGTALKNSSDLDCILIMNNIPDAVQLKANINSVLYQIRSYLEKQPFARNGWRVTVRKVSEYLVQFEMTNNSNQTVQVDLLPTFEANVEDRQARLNLYEMMASSDETTRSYCSAALAEIQRDFVIERPAKLKDLIRLVKHWAKTYLPRPSIYPQRMPSSYLIELVTIYCWEQAGSLHKFNTAALFRKIMLAFYSHTQLNVSWDRYYTLIRPTSPPAILDPANPYNDLYNDVNGWNTVEQVARDTLRMPLLQSM